MDNYKIESLGGSHFKLVDKPEPQNLYSPDAWKHLNDDIMTALDVYATIKELFGYYGYGFGMGQGTVVVMEYESRQVERCTTIHEAFSFILEQIVDDAIQAKAKDRKQENAR